MLNVINEFHGLNMLNEFHGLNMLNEFHGLNGWYGVRHTGHLTH